MKPGSAGQPMFGIDAVIIDPVSAEIITEAGKEGVLAIRQPWPSIARTIWRAHQRYTETYFNVYKGFYVSTGPNNIRTRKALTRSTVHG